MKRISLLVLVGVFLWGGIAIATPVQWTTAAGGNNHWYEAVSHTAYWDEANVLAENSYHNGIQGHLVTIGDLDENNWVWNTLSSVFGSVAGFF